jgi:hypothetical protein
VPIRHQTAIQTPISSIQSTVTMLLRTSEPEVRTPQAQPSPCPVTRAAATGVTPKSLLRSFSKQDVTSPMFAHTLDYDGEDPGGRMGSRDGAFHLMNLVWPDGRTRWDPKERCASHKVEVLAFLCLFVIQVTYVRDMRRGCFMYPLFTAFSHPSP